jgi:ribosomal-protein-alanine N-acetyltransferase
VFRTERLILRRWRESDLAPFAAINSDIHAMRYMPFHLSRAQSDEWVKHIEAEFERDGFDLWALESTMDGMFIGFTGLNQVPFRAAFTPAVEIGWRLAPACWGKGYATEAGRRALELGFLQFGLSEIVAETTAINSPSRNVMSRIGMKNDSKDDFMHPDVPLDHPLCPHVLYRSFAADRTQFNQPNIKS